MAQPSQSDAENDYRDPLDTFTDREAILALFEQTLRSAQAGRLHLLAVKGNSGTGKTFLVSYLAERVCPHFQWQFGQIRFAQSALNFRTVLLGLEDALKGSIPSARLEHYRAERNEYIRRFDEYKGISIGSIQQHMEARDQSSIANSPQSIQMNAQLHERELHLRSELTRALLELAEAGQQSSCLFIDGYERLTALDAELVGWLWEEVLPGLARAIPHPFLVMTCGWEWPSNAAIEPFMRQAELTDFDVEQMKSYLHKQEVLPSPTTPTEIEREQLVSAFYELTKGHPLVLALTVTYFQHLDRSEQTTSHLQANLPLLDTRSRVEFVEQRLLNPLPEPDRTLLERGPILRFLDQGALQALLSVEIEGMTGGMKMLDDSSYDRFLRYPFINRESRVEEGSEHLEPSFHELVRRVQVETLRHRPHEAKEQLHRTMADYYRGRFEAEVPGHEFRARVEYLYHSLQVRTRQAEAFEEWRVLMVQAINHWQRQQARSLLALVRQLVEEGEPFLSKTSQPYGDYLLWYGRLLEQEVQWQQAQNVLEEAAKIFEQVGNQVAFSIALNNLAALYQVQGKYKQAESLFTRALAIYEQQLGSEHPITAQSLNNLALLYNVATILHNLAGLYYIQGQYEQAELLYRLTLSIYEQQLGSEHPDTAHSLNNLALLYYAQGKYEQAEPLYRRALAIVEKQLGLKHPATAQCLNNLAALYSAQGKYEQAEPLFKRALAIQERQLGPEHPDTAQSLNSLAALYSAQGQYEQAEPLYRRALAIAEQQLGPQHPITAQCLNNLAALYQVQGHYEQAKPLYRRALAIREEQLGSEHPDTAQSLNSLAALYQVQGHYEQAELLFKRALAIYEKQLGPEHPATAQCLNNLAELYRTQGKYEQAELLYRRALAIREEQLGSEHPDTAQSLNNLALLYSAQGKYEQAEPLYRRALAIQERQLGSEHPNVAIDLNNLAALYYAQGKYEQAEPLYRRALAIVEKQLGLKHPATAQCLNNLAALYRTQGKYEQAEPLYRRALAIREEQLGSEHPDTAQSLNSLAALYSAQGQYEQAEPLYRRALAIQERQLGPEHPDVATSLHNLAALYYIQGQYEQAEPLYRRALAIAEQQLGPQHPATVTIRENYYALVEDIQQEGKEQH